MVRLTREAWFNVSLDILATRGATNLTIDNLTSALHVTKGSFYHHFDSYATFKTALLSFFEYTRTQNVIEVLEQVHDVTQKLQRLFAVAAQHLSPAETAIRAWAIQDEEVRHVQARVDQQRMAYLQALYLSLGVDIVQARLMAQLSYSILVGTQHIQPTLSPDDVHALLNEFCRVYNIG